MRAFLAAVVFLIMVQTTFAADPRLGMTETKRVNRCDVTVFVQPHGVKVIVQLVVVGTKPESIQYDDMKVVGIDDAGAEVPMEKFLPTVEVFADVNGSGTGTYKLTLPEGRRLKAVKVAWGGETASYPVKEPAQ